MKKDNFLDRIFSKVTNIFLTIAIVVLILVVIYLTVNRYVFEKIVKTASIATIILLILFLTYRKVNQREEESEEEAMEKDKQQILEAMRRVQKKMENDIEIYQGPVEQKIQEVDKNFQKEEFNELAKMLFMKVEQAFNKRDYDEIRTFESRELFEQHKIQIQNCIDNKTINVKNGINIIYAKIYDFRQTVDKDILIVILKACLKEYVVDEKSGEILSGNNREKVQYYKMEFIRKKGVKTQDSVNHLKTINCPNCGGPFQIVFVGECPYCGSIIMEGRHNWLLNDLELLKEII